MPAYDDEAALAAFAAAVDVVTLEFENVPVAALEFLAAALPGAARAPRVLRVTQDRLAEKDFVRGAGLPGDRLCPRRDRPPTWRGAVEQLGPGVLKTARLGYDGKGQIRVDAGDRPGRSDRIALGQPVLIHEAWVEFALELSVITARNPRGRMASYVPVENRHRDHILDVTIAPARDPRRRRGRGRGHGRADRARRWSSRGCWRSRCSSPATAGCWSTSWRRGRTIPATGPSTPARSASSSSRCARSAACRWAIRTRSPMRR